MQRAARVGAEMQEMREMWREVLDHQRSGAGSTSVSQAHPDYDQSLDEEPLGQDASMPMFQFQSVAVADFDFRCLCLF